MELSDLADLIDRAIGEEIPRKLGVAVSGGGDSVALLLGLREWGRVAQLHVVTVDHGLRNGSGNEAAQVAELAGTLGYSHRTLEWAGWDGKGNLQDMARRARYGLMAEWARENDIPAVALGHTADDQAETFLMRLGRRAGLDGLSGMPVRRIHNGTLWLRPLLAARRNDLRELLTNEAQAWIDDPSNEMREFDRIKARQLLAKLSELNITAEALAQVAAQLAESRRVIAEATRNAWRDIGREEMGDLVIDREGYARLDREIARRLLVAALQWVSAAQYRPRREAVSQVQASIASGTGATLHGCQIKVGNHDIRVFRELSPVIETSVPANLAWDGRWIARHPGGETGYTIGALGEAGIRDCPRWRESGRPREAILSSPSIWRGSRLVAAPHAGLEQDWQIIPAPGRQDFETSLLSR